MLNGVCGYLTAFIGGVCRYKPVDIITLNPPLLGLWRKVYVCRCVYTCVYVYIVSVSACHSLLTLLTPPLSLPPPSLSLSLSLSLCVCVCVCVVVVVGVCAFSLYLSPG